MTTKGKGAMVTTITSTIAPDSETQFDVTFQLCQQCLIDWIYAYREWLVETPTIREFNYHINVCDQCGGSV